MTANEVFTGNELVQSIELKVKSLKILISEIRQSCHNDEFDPSICNDINEYLQIVQTDCQTIMNDNNKLLYNTTQNIYEDKKILQPIQMINNEDYYKQKMQKFEVEINYKVDDVIKSIESTTDTLNAYHKENLLLDEQTNDIYQKLNLQKNILNQEIDKFNNTDFTVKNAFCKWKESIIKTNDENVLLVNEARKLISKYQQSILGYLMNIENQIKENQKEIFIKRQKVDEENTDIKKLENLCADKNKAIMDAQIEIEKKQSQLENIELKYKKESKELEIIRLEQQKKKNNLKIMNSIMKYHDKETKEKIQFYNDNIIRPLELKLEKCISLVDQEKNKNNNINITSIMELVPEFKENIKNTKSQIEKLDKTLSAQYGTMTKLEEDYKDIQLNILRQTEISSIKTEKFIDIFDAILNYRMKMLNVVEMREKNIILDSKVFQKRYEIKKKREECSRRENGLMSQLDKLKQLVRQQAKYNKQLSQQYIQLTNK
ncbi:repetitive organellar protein-like isoform X3 [Aphis gossypii]|uniref:repetitive organellar protein-like isoform X3 n=1 Tax=Aphis gossypii TaxID=80765 RepID=UPI002159A4A5|nr:repetitive organellar protein-like isoform X3 [Aphis gossypii]